MGGGGSADEVGCSADGGDDGYPRGCGCVAEVARMLKVVG